jgi:L-rhamnose 1-dehydrogenase
MLLKDKVLLVTGASAGIGRAVAIEAARQGADVAINHFDKTDDAADSAVAAIQALGRKAIAVKSDVADPDSAPAFIAAAVAALGKVDVFVSNAGICPFHAFLDMPRETFERTMAVNLHGAYFMIQAAANQMMKQGHGGAIIGVSSISAYVGGEYQTHYTPTKAGVLSMMNSVAIALGKHGIRCNAVLPGTIQTDINKEDLSDPKKRAYMEGRVPLGRLGVPEDLAGPVIFLASDMARYVNGAALLVDGGMFVNLQ